jgi:hypothetical protein
MEVVMEYTKIILNSILKFSELEPEQLGLHYEALRRGVVSTLGDRGQHTGRPRSEKKLKFRLLGARSVFS